MASNSREDRSNESADSAAQELRRFAGLSASLYRAAAARVGMAVTDIQIIDLIESSGAATPGELAELTGLTTGAIAGILNRLEDSGLLRRERDLADGRRVIVRLDPGSGKMQEVASVFQSLSLAWRESITQLNDEQTAFIVELLRRSNAASRAEIVRLREAPQDGQAPSSAPLEGVSSGHLIVSGATKLIITVDRAMTDLYHAVFEGTSPLVKVRDGRVSIRYPHKLSNLFGTQRSVAVTLGATIPWEITVQGGAAMIDAQLVNLKLAGFDAEGGGSVVKLDLPVPTAVVPVRLSGGGSMITVRRPAGAAVQAHLNGSGSQFGFDGKTYYAIGNGVWLKSTDYAAGGPSYAIEIASSGSSVTISSM